jgi:hypothetical protein
VLTIVKGRAYNDIVNFSYEAYGGEKMKASQHQEIEKTSLILSEKIPKLSESEKAFVEGILTGLQMNKAQPAAKEPEKQEEVK